MTEREKRIANNEAVARDINEAIEQAHNEASQDGLVRMMCECGLDACERLITISVLEYEEIRQNPKRFAAFKDHVLPDVEDVVVELDRYVVVQKREDTGGEVAVARNPRAS